MMITMQEALEAHKKGNPVWCLVDDQGTGKTIPYDGTPDSVSETGVYLPGIGYRSLRDVYPTKTDVRQLVG